MLITIQFTICSSWFLDSITVYVNGSERFYFPCNKWLAKDEGDGQICRDLFAVGADSQGDLTHYEVKVYTGDKRAAGTDANGERK